ncbi:GNAT family N-acetyltransferase [Spiractinospora alimapuensis]|uniref:GNAT family N-acetyltransferase n=1 Tax=Spiractinospora alimapuensis TaxID=2820884 RepID=UPI001F28A981|nr:GNAT family N-acetyltransferase [Spiractinospora alimapuensis]QVQ53910.1 GNAT family N-acetyltransferase [Spiractinospora alimapuensis]
MRTGESEAPESVIRTASRSDIPALVALVNSAYRGAAAQRGWTTETEFLDGQRIDHVTLEGFYDTEGTVFLVLESAGTPLACCELNAPKDGAGGTAYLGMLTVNPDAQAGGVGRRVLAEAEDYAARHWAARRVRMLVLRQRSSLIAWYERRGYALTGDTAPFPYGDERFGIPRRDDLEFVELRKELVPDTR